MSNRSAYCKQNSSNISFFLWVIAYPEFQSKCRILAQHTPWATLLIDRNLYRSREAQTREKKISKVRNSNRWLDKLLRTVSTSFQVLAYSRLASRWRQAPQKLARCRIRGALLCCLVSAYKDGQFQFFDSQLVRFFLAYGGFPEIRKRSPEIRSICFKKM